MNSPTSFLSSASFLAGLIALSGLARAEDAKRGPVSAPAVAAAAKSPAWPAGKPLAPATLPGKGLAQHDFLYAGEAKTRDMYIVRKGAVVWEYHETAGRGEISDAVLLSNGNILFAHQYGVSLINPARKMLWHREAPENCEIHTAQPIGTGRVCYIQNGPEPKVIVVNLATDTNEREFPLPVANATKTHGQFRHARLTAAGTLLVAHLDLRKVCEYDEHGKTLWSVDAPTGAWAAERLKNGHTLISGGRTVREVNAQGETVWEFTSADVPDYRFDSIQIATRLPNGHTLINNWVNQWSGTIDAATVPVQALEISKDKQVVWALRSWVAPNLGPSTIIQLLDEPGAPENAHFGSIR